ncbi:MAG: hypothetical protein ACO3QA_07220, partial [Phycisphaerales bacterium]
MRSPQAFWELSVASAARRPPDRCRARRAAAAAPRAGGGHLGRRGLGRTAPGTGHGGDVLL